MIPYCRHVLGDEEVRAAEEALRSGWIARGPRVRQFEAQVAELLGASHAVACSSGTAGLELALRALDIGPGDEVLVPTLTWVATAMAVRNLGARPVFVDIDPVTSCAAVASAEDQVGPRTRAAIVVDFAGRPHDHLTWSAFAARHGLGLIVDAAHSFGGRHPDAVPVGADGKGDLTVFSFHPAKTITTGEGGLVTTSDPDLAQRLIEARAGGITREFADSRGHWDYLARTGGSNHFMTEVQAAIGLVQLGRLEDLLEARRERWAWYGDCMSERGLQSMHPVHPAGSAFNLFITELPARFAGLRRDALIQDLRKAGIGVHVHYPLLHRQPVFASADPGDDSSFPHAVRYEASALTLPMHPTLERHECELVVTELHRLLSASQEGEAIVAEQAGS